MVFSSYLFLFGFLPLALLFYFAAPRRFRNAVLTLVSYLFYGWVQPVYVLLLLGSTLLDWTCGLGIAGYRLGGPAPQALDPEGPRTPRQRRFLLLSILGNLSVLGFFKYFHFGLDTWNATVTAFGRESWTIQTALQVALPLGISFYTFQSLSYTIDVYRGRTRAMLNPVDFACFVSMFPQLVAGPIVRFSEVAEQLRSRRTSLSLIARGAAFFCVGLAKKVLLANPCGKIADTVFDATSTDPLTTWYGLFAYSFQIYFDFSGYSDMAIGLGLILGFILPKNFDQPYRARSLTDFWRRWHLSLSFWLRDYLYIPLGGNRKGKLRTYINLFLVMFLGGLWHGASWNFALWGVLHGIWLALERAFGVERSYRQLPAWLSQALVFLGVSLLWIPFRAPNLEVAQDIFRRLLGLANPDGAWTLVGDVVYSPYLVGTFLIAAAVTWAAPPSWSFTREIGWGKASWLVVLYGLSIAALATQKFNPFLYFIF
jgi:alginate O-acetyltransferase complex protein AlgI